MGSPATRCAAGPRHEVVWFAPDSLALQIGEHLLQVETAGLGLDLIPHLGEQRLGLILEPGEETPQVLPTESPSLGIVTAWRHGPARRSS